MLHERLRPLTVILYALASFVVVFGLGACNQPSPISAALNFSVTQDELDGVKLAYASVQAPMAAYRNLGFCKTGTVFTVAKPCADRGVVAKLIAENRLVRADIKAVQAAITAGDSSGAFYAFNLLNREIDTAKQLIATINS